MNAQLIAQIETAFSTMTPAPSVHLSTTNRKIRDQAKAMMQTIANECPEGSREFSLALTHTGPAGGCGTTIS